MLQIYIWRERYVRNYNKINNTPFYVDFYSLYNIKNLSYLLFFSYSCKKNRPRKYIQRMCITKNMNNNQIFNLLLI